MSAFEVPTMLAARRVSDVWTMLPSWFPLPGMGMLAINSFLLKGREPVLVDTGLGALGDAFMEALETEIDPGDLAWIWLSHMDADHVGNLGRVLERAPNARIVTNFLGMGKMGLAGLDVSRVHMLQPGDAIEAGGQQFHAFMLRQTREHDLMMFAEMAKAQKFENKRDVPFSILLPAFVTSELKTAFQIGFMLFLPFLVIDLVVSSVLMSLGMMMMSPMIVSLPFKLLLFVLVDGWALLMGSLASSFG